MLAERWCRVSPAASQVLSFLLPQQPSEKEKGDEEREIAVHALRVPTGTAATTRGHGKACRHRVVRQLISNEPSGSST